MVANKNSARGSADAYHHLLVATDFSAAAAAAIVRALDLARRTRAKLTILHVIPYFPAIEPSDVITPENEDPARFVPKDARQRLRQIDVGTHHGLVRRSVRTTSGSIADGISQQARNLHAGLIVLGAGEHRLLGTLVGSVIEGVLKRAPCDVMVVRAQTDDGSPSSADAATRRRKAATKSRSTRKRTGISHARR